jgi:hypothetical protein
MSTTTLTRLSGLALMVAFALSLTGGMLHPVIGGDSHAAPSLAQPFFPSAHLLVFLGEICLLFGLPRPVRHHRSESGAPGAIGLRVALLRQRRARQLCRRLRGLRRPRVGHRPHNERPGGPRGCHSLLGSVCLTRRGGQLSVHAGARGAGPRGLPLQGNAGVDRGADGRFSDLPVGTCSGGARPYRPADRAAARARRGGHGVRTLRPRRRGAHEYPGSTITSTKPRTIRTEMPQSLHQGRVSWSS